MILSSLFLLLKQMITTAVTPSSTLFHMYSTVSEYMLFLIIMHQYFRQLHTMICMVRLQMLYYIRHTGKL